jgi:hypothetical protein
MAEERAERFNGDLNAPVGAGVYGAIPEGAGGRCPPRGDQPRNRNR